MTLVPIATQDSPTTGRSVARLKRRAEFLHVAKGRRWHGSAVTIQSAARNGGAEDVGVSRLGFTLTKKVGNAVVRNRARRRLREAVRLAANDLPLDTSHDYVIIGRLQALRLPFDALRRELVRGIESVHQTGKARGGRHHRDHNTPAERTAPERIRPTP